jgi:glycosyltransferase involved in cell wall biosynthesis
MTRVATPMSPADATTDRRPRIAYLSFSSGEYDARTFRMARSAIAAGYRVTVYARWHPGLAPVEERDGYRLVRAPFDWRLAIPGLRGAARRRAAREMAAAQAAIDRDAMAAPRRPDQGMTDEATDDQGTEEAPEAAIDDLDETGAAAPRGVLAAIARLANRSARRVGRPVMRPIRRWRRTFLIFPMRPLGWARALDDVVEPADIWHGMWAGSLPALMRMRRRHGGATIYDSRDVYMQSRGFATSGRPGRTILEWLERRWAHRVDQVITVNDPYAALLVDQLRITRPPVVMNCPETWTPPEPRPDLIRDALGLSTETMVALYQGRLVSDRGIEQAMDAILDVPNGFLGLLGFGEWEEKLTEQVSAPPYLGRVALLPPVAPESLLDWTSSADVAVMAIQPTSVNHHFTTPQKLFESLAAGVPVVASDLPGMADIIRETRAGVVCDPTSPASIAEAIRSITAAQPAEREAMRRRALDAAHARYNWGAQVDTLLDIYRGLSPRGSARARAPQDTRDRGADPRPG